MARASRSSRHSRRRSGLCYHEQSKRASLCRRLSRRSLRTSRRSASRASRRGKELVPPAPEELTGRSCILYLVFHELTEQWCPPRVPRTIARQVDQRRHLREVLVETLEAKRRRRRRPQKPAKRVHGQARASSDHGRATHVRGDDVWRQGPQACDRPACQPPRPHVRTLAWLDASTARFSDPSTTENEEKGLTESSASSPRAPQRSTSAAGANLKCRWSCPDSKRAACSVGYAAEPYATACAATVPSTSRCTATSAAPSKAHPAASGRPGCTPSETCNDTYSTTFTAWASCSS